MNTRVMFIAAGLIAAAAIAIFVIFVMGTPLLLSANELGQSNANGGNSTPGAFQASNLGISVQSIKAVKQDPKNAKVTVSFEVNNPNRISVLLETVHYTLIVDKHQMTLGDTGEPLEGFLASQASSTLIIAGGNATLSDSEVVTRNNLTGTAWDSMVNGSALYHVDGYYSFRATEALQTSYQEINFSFTYP